MPDFAVRAGGVILASAIGLGWGWVAAKVFSRPFVMPIPVPHSPRFSNDER